MSQLRLKTGYLPVLLAPLLITALTAAGSLAETYTQLHQFTGGSDGAVPPYSPTYDEKGDLYGSTYHGGAICDVFSNPCGTVYKISPAGQETTLFAFDGANGQNPDGPLTLVDHTLYGSTYTGGPNAYALNGVLFSLHTDGTRFTLLHTFAGTDGQGPTGPLLAGPQGVFYGVTLYGGPKRSSAGVLFKLMPGGRYVHLHDFNGGTEGTVPQSLSIDSAGTLYGSTSQGTLCSSGCGSIFKYVPSTRVFSVLQQFKPHDGTYPKVGSIGPDGTIYGAARNEGPDNGGTLFQLAPTGGSYMFTRLYTFLYESPSVGVGYHPSGGPILTSYGALIGTTDSGNETLYKFKSNHMSVLYSFPANTDAAPPNLDKNGTIYGATTQGDIVPCTTPTYTFQFGCGTVYSLLRTAP